MCRDRPRHRDTVVQYQDCHTVKVLCGHGLQSGYVLIYTHSRLPQQQRRQPLYPPLFLRPLCSICTKLIYLYQMSVERRVKPLLVGDDRRQRAPAVRMTA